MVCPQTLRRLCRHGACKINIFVLDEDPALCAQYHVDKHVVKMILETAQLLCTTHYRCGLPAPYKKTHENHPCTKWISESINNYEWLCLLGTALCDEYTFRYNKIHKSKTVIDWARLCVPNLPKIPRTKWALAIPEECRTADAVESYRKYYVAHKSDLFKWTGRERPSWIKETDNAIR